LFTDKKKPGQMTGLFFFDICDMRDIFLLLGSNRGDRLKMLEQAKTMIAENCGSIIRISSLYESEPWGFTDDTPFINQVVELETAMNPEELMEQLMAIETKLGRFRIGNWKQEAGCRMQDAGSCISEPGEHESCIGSVATINREHSKPYSSRTIDIDILFFGQKMIFTEKLMIPHPRLHERRFTLEPMNEIAPGFIHPILKKNINTLLENCTDQHKVSSGVFRAKG